MLGGGTHVQCVKLWEIVGLISHIQGFLLWKGYAGSPPCIYCFVLWWDNVPPQELVGLINCAQNSILGQGSTILLHHTHHFVLQPYCSPMCHWNQQDKNCCKALPSADNRSYHVNPLATHPIGNQIIAQFIWSPIKQYPCAALQWPLWGIIQQTPKAHLHPLPGIPDPLGFVYTFCWCMQCRYIAIGNCRARQHITCLCFLFFSSVDSTVGWGSYHIQCAHSFPILIFTTRSFITFQHTKFANMAFLHAFSHTLHPTHPLPHPTGNLWNHGVMWNRGWHWPNGTWIDVMSPIV